MNQKELKKTLNEIKGAIKKNKPNLSEKEINKTLLDNFFRSYCDDEITRDDLEAVTIALGYEINEEVLDEIEKEKRGK